MDKWNKLANQVSIQKTIAALKTNGMNAIVVNNKEEAKKVVLKILPKGASVMDMSSVTLSNTGIAKEINESGDYDSIRNKLNKMDRVTQAFKMQQLGAAPEWTVGSVHAVTEDGHILIASNSGSQLPAYANGASHVVWVVGTQKIVKNIDEGIKRIYEHSLPLESERVKKAYGMPYSEVKKILIINKEGNSDRIKIVLVKEKLGF